MEKVFFDGWFNAFRPLLVGLLAYVVLVVFLRVSGKRTLSKMNAFDLVVTVALGSTLATVLLSKDVALAEGAAAFLLLVGLQFVVTWLSVRSTWVRRLVKSEPTLLLYKGQFIAHALRRQRVTRNEVQAAIRATGLANIEDAEAVVLETDASFSVVSRTGSGLPSSLEGLRIPDRSEEQSTTRGAE